MNPIKKLNQKWWSEDIAALIRYADYILNANFAATRESAKNMYERKRQSMIERYGKTAMKGL